jgi:hypothetical protein
VLDSASNQTATFTLGRLYRIMNPSLTATGLTFANNSSSGNTITRNSESWNTDGFVPGEQITISGSNNAGTYTVQGVTDSTLTVVNVNNAPWAEAGTLSNHVTITSQGAFRFGETFDAAAQVISANATITPGVNTASDTITFAQPDDFQTGDAVQIDDQGNPDLGNIDPSQTYYVRKVDDYTIQLCATLDDAFATPDGVSPSEYDSSNSSFYLYNLWENHLNEDQPIPVTYNAPSPTTFTASDVNVTTDDQGNQQPDANTIYLTSNNFTRARRSRIRTPVRSLPSWAMALP